MLCSHLTAPRSLTQRPSSGLFPGSLSGSRAPNPQWKVRTLSPEIPQYLALLSVDFLRFHMFTWTFSYPCHPPVAVSAWGRGREGESLLLVGAPQCQGRAVPERTTTEPGFTSLPLGLATTFQQDPNLTSAYSTYWCIPSI